MRKKRLTQGNKVVDFSDVRFQKDAIERELGALDAPYRKLCEIIRKKEEIHFLQHETDGFFLRHL